jgi:hypothetical protein
MRRAREGGHPRLLDAPHRDGQRVSATLRQAAGKYLAADLFSAGNTVEHLVGAPAANAERTIAFATPSPGTRLLTVVLSSTPLDLGKDAGTRNAAAYLAALAEAVRASPDALADMATFEIRAASIAAPVASRPPHNPRCAGILERAQLGEPLSDADRAILRGECR